MEKNKIKYSLNGIDMTLDPDGDLCFMTHQTRLPCGQKCIKHFCSPDVHSKMLFFQEK